MYGIVEIAGHQYQVKAGDLIDVEKLKVEAGSDVIFDQVLFIGGKGEGEKTLVGLPTVAGAQVTARVIRHDRSRKVIVFKRRPGAWRRKKGHRQEFTALLITAVNDGNGNVVELAKDHKFVKKYLESSSNQE